MHQADWIRKDLTTLRAFSFYNLSVAHAVRGDIEMALKNFNMVSLALAKTFFL